MFWFYTQNKANSKKELALSASSLTFLASGSSLDLNIISNIPQDEITYEVNSTGIFTVTRSGYKLTIETDNLGATVTHQQSSTLTVKARNLTATCTLIREANYIKSLKIGGGSTTSFIPSTITYSAAGGSNPFTGWAVYTSGGQTCITTWAAGDWVLPQSYFSKTLSNGIVTVTGEYRGTTVGSSRTGTLTVNLKSAATENKQLSTSVTLTQAENTKTTTYSDITITAFGYSEAPASGSTLSPTLSYKQTKTDSYTLGASVPTTITSGASIAYSGNGVNTSTGAVTVPSRGTVEGSRTGYTSSTVTVSNSGKTAKSTVTVFQAANEVTSKKITPRTPVPQTDTLPATNAYYSYNSGECDLVYKYSSGASKVEISIGEPGASQYGLGITFQLVDSSDSNISAAGNSITFGTNTTTSERYAIVNMKFISNESDWISDIYQIKITQEAKSGPGTLTIKFLGTSPQIAWYVTTSIGSNRVVVTGPTRYTVTSSLNGFNILENELAVLLAINPGSGNIYVNLSATSGGTVSYKATLSQVQAASLSNGTNISIFAVKNV